MKKHLNLEDDIIITRVVAGEKNLFRLLVERHEGKVYSLGMSFFKDHEEAADFTQEVFLKAYQNLSSFQGRSRFSTWLYRIGYNTAINSLQRKKEYYSLIEEDIEIPVLETPENQLILKVTKEALLEAMQNLPDRYRVCIDLFFFYECTYDEIVNITGFPTNTIKSHVFRAKKLLRKKLSEQEGML